MLTWWYPEEVIPSSERSKEDRRTFSSRTHCGCSRPADEGLPSSDQAREEGTVRLVRRVAFDVLLDGFLYSLYVLESLWCVVHFKIAVRSMPTSATRIMLAPFCNPFMLRCQLLPPDRKGAHPAGERQGGKRRHARGPPRARGEQSLLR